MVVGGGPSRALMIFTATRPPDASPLLLVLDTAMATAAAAAAREKEGGLRSMLSPGLCTNDGGDGDCDGDVVRTVEEEGQQEVELSTRCCSKSVFSASLHAVFVNPTEAKAFVCQRLRRRGAHGGDAWTPAASQGLAKKFGGLSVIVILVGFHPPLVHVQHVMGCLCAHKFAPNALFCRQEKLRTWIVLPTQVPRLQLSTQQHAPVWGDLLSARLRRRPLGHGGIGPV